MKNKIKSLCIAAISSKKIQWQKKILFKIAKKYIFLQIYLKRNTFQKMPYFKKYKWKKTVFLVEKPDFQKYVNFSPAIYRDDTIPIKFQHDWF